VFSRPCKFSSTQYPCLWPRVSRGPVASSGHTGLAYKKGRVYSCNTSVRRENFLASRPETAARAISIREISWPRTSAWTTLGQEVLGHTLGRENTALDGQELSHDLDQGAFPRRLGAPNHETPPATTGWEIRLRTLARRTRNPQILRPTQSRGSEDCANGVRYIRQPPSCSSRRRDGGTGCASGA
jgi:hypothetical protein